MLSPEQSLRFEVFPMCHVVAGEPNRITHLFVTLATDLDSVRYLRAEFHRRRSSFLARL
jgi:hypothetical protein